MKLTCSWALAGLLLLSTQVLLAADTPKVANPFVHPGMLHSRAELAFVKQKIIAGESPWESAWERLQSSRSSSLNYKPKPFANVVRGVRNNPNVGSSDMSNDSAAAYTHALQWCLTAKQAHAAKAIEILNAWSAKLESVSGHDARLLIGMAGMGFCNAAELMYHYRTLSSKSRGRFAPIYERIVHHYHDRMGLEMPYSRKVAEKRRPEHSSSTHMPWGTLMFYGLPRGLNAMETNP